jgi:hypothetical protein
MNGLTNFVHHSNTREIIAALNEALVPHPTEGTRGILLLCGSAKTGKKHIVRHWFEQLKADETGFVAPHQLRIVVVPELWEPLRKTSTNNYYVTPKACILFSEIVFAMGKVSTKISPTYAHRTWYREPKSLRTDSEFAGLFSFVRSECNRLRVRLLVINNAHLLDRCCIERLMNLYSHCEQKLGLVLVTRLQTNASLDEPLADEIGQVTEAASRCRRVELQRVTKAEYMAVVLDELAEQLALDVDDALLPHEEVIAELFWQHTGPDWKLIQDRLARPLDSELGTRTGNRRILTRGILENVLGRPLPW